MTRIRVFTGKGGVGKTSVAVAHAWRLAEAGERTLLLSTDAAHSIGDVLDQKIGSEVVRVANNLDAVELDTNRIMESDYGNLVGSLTSMMESLGASDITPEEDPSLSIPGFDGLLALLQLLDFTESGNWDSFVVDCAPTGETLALLKFPELLGWYVEKWLPMGKVAVRALSPLSRKIFKVDLPDKHAMSDIERLYARLLDLQELLKDTDTTTVRIVTLAEKMVVEETKRNYLYLNLFGYRVDGLIINRVLPKEAAADFFSEWTEIQSNCIDQIEQVFAAVPVARLPWYETDICGLQGIARMAAALPPESLFSDAPKIEHERYRETDEGWLLELYMPLAQKGEMELYRAGADLVVRIGGFTRCIPLPNTLLNRDVRGAALENSLLVVKFAKEITDGC